MTASLRLSCAMFALFGLAGLRVDGQELVTVNVSTDPTGARYTVDGLQYTGPTSFNWPVGSKHVVSIVSPTYTSVESALCEIESGSSFTQYEPGCRARFKFNTWETSAGTLPSASNATQAITVDRNLNFIRAVFAVEYRVDLALYEGGVPSTPDTCSANARNPGPNPYRTGPGVVIVNGVCYERSAQIWVPRGQLTGQAIPFEGYVFRGWSMDVGPVNPASFAAITITGPMVLHPRFEPAKRVRVYTNPYELRLRIDNTEVFTIDPAHFPPVYPMPGYFDMATGSQHIFGAVSPQIDLSGRSWVFERWSNGGGQNMVMRVDDQTNVPLELTANFVRGVPVQIVTEPAGLKVNVEGRDNWPSFNFTWGVGISYTASAPAEQRDMRGRKYVFESWSNGASGTQTIVPKESEIGTGVRLVARYEAVPQAVFQSSIPGMKISVNGNECVSPCRFDQPNGTAFDLRVPTVVPISEVSRYEFTGWNDGGPAVRSFTLNSDAALLVANYRIANRLSTVVDPSEGAVFAVQPESADGYYASDALVSIAVEPKPGFRFRRWDGDLSGTARTGVVAMSMSRTVRALLDRVPFVEPTGVRNAAGDLPEPGVAPGLIAIYGGSLAKGHEAGTSNPLPQTLAGTVVLVEDRLLPLVYVSPQQINAQLPADLTPGDYRLTVRTTGMADVVSQFTIVRNAPGLFANPVDGVPYAAALHENGSPVTAQSPAKRDETVTLLGTGFGPYDRPVLDGFVTPVAPAAALVDPVDVVVAGASVGPTVVGAAPGLVGMTATRFRVGAVSGNVEVKVVVNGRESNTVVLPVE